MTFHIGIILIEILEREVETPPFKISTQTQS